MRHVFILNPTAGKKQAALSLQEGIRSYFAAHPELEYTVYLTDGVGSATRIAAEECATGDSVRLYACGGDGTLQETANGIPLDGKAELAVVPCGSGNDYVRSFGEKEAFLNLSDLIEGEAFPVDAIDCGDRLSLNIASIGMDASVGQKMSRYKNLPGISGSMAYNLAVADVFCHPIGAEMEIEMDTDEGVLVRKGRYLMTLAANGRYYGGGYCGAPGAQMSDGELDLVLVRKVPRLVIPFILGKYKAGKHDGVKCIEHLRGTAMRVRSSKTMVCNIDGECFDTNQINFTIIPDAFRLVLPKSLALARKTAENELVLSAAL